MKKNNVFIASPIAGFLTNQDYDKYSNLLKEVVENLKRRNNIGNIYCEIANITNILEYDSPAKSVVKDFKHIKESDFFILLYPQKIVSSALIELGYAVAENKNILIISPYQEILPYMVLGFEEVYKNIKVKITEYSYQNLLELINNFIEAE